MLVPLTLLALAVPAPPPLVEQDCDKDCVAVLTAALEWTRSRVATQWAESVSEHPHIFLDIGRMRNPPTGEETPELRAQNRALTAIAAKLGIPAQRSEEDELWRRCTEGPESAECRAARGRTAVTVRRLDFVSPEEARIHSAAQSLTGDHRGWYATAWELHLRRINGEWQVVKGRRFMGT